MEVFSVMMAFINGLLFVLNVRFLVGLSRHRFRRGGGIWFVSNLNQDLFGGMPSGDKSGRRLYKHPLSAGTAYFIMEYNRLVNSINTLQDIYDNETTNIKKEYLDTVFVIDEFRALKGLTPQTENYFTRILNVSKSAVDFILIAQLPTYFESDTRDLGEGCSYFERGDRMGKPHHSIEWKFDKKAGTPTRIGNKWDTEFFEYRERLPKYFNMYHSYSAESEQLMLERGEDHRVLPFWKKRSFKYGCIVFGITVIIAIIGLFLLKSSTDALDKLTTKKEKQQIENNIKLEQPKTRKLVSNSDYQENKICYTQIWVNDGIVTYKLNNGNYAYNPTYLIERCSRSFEWNTDKNR